MTTINPKVIFGAGHTTDSPGVIYQDLKEADLTRKILEYTIPHLESSGLNFDLLPLDLDQPERVKWLNNQGLLEKNNDIYVEIHINSDGKKGVQGWFKGSKSETNKSQKLTEELTNYISSNLKVENQGAKSEFQHKSGYLIIFDAKLIPTCLEILCIDDPEEYTLLKSETKLQEIAKHLVDGVKAYIEKIKNELSNQQNSNSTNSTNSQNQNTNNIYGNPVQLAPTSVSISTTTNNINTTTSKKLMTKEERKEMIINTYKKILGRDPLENEITKYLNEAIDEISLIKKLLDSDEHKNLIENGKAYKDKENELKKFIEEKKIIEAKNNQIEKTLEALYKINKLKDQKIRVLQNKLIEKEIIKKGQFFDHIKAEQELINTQQNKTIEDQNKNKIKQQKKESMAKKIIRFLKI